MESKKILVVEDERDIRELIEFNLKVSGHDVKTVDRGDLVFDAIQDYRPDLILLDIMLPGMDGISILKTLRDMELGKKIKIIMVTAKSEEADIIKGLEIGADDYVTKPFSPRILLARVSALLRRFDSSEDHDSAQISLFGIDIDLKKKHCTIEGKSIELTYTEFQVLHLLMSDPGHVFSRSRIVDMTRGENHAITDRAVDVQILNLRKKLGEKGTLIETVRGFGYRLREVN